MRRGWPSYEASGMVWACVQGHTWPKELFVKTSVSTVKMTTIPISAEMTTMGGMPAEIGTPRSS